MFSRCRVFLAGGRRWWKEGRPDFTRAQRRRDKLEGQRLRVSAAPPPVDPTAVEACRLYHQLLRMGNKTLVVTDKKYFQKTVRHEFEVTARRTSARVRGIMFEKGKWMLANDLGGVV